METQRRVEARFECERWQGTEWIVAAATVKERLNEPYEIELDLALAEPSADAGAMLGGSCALTLHRRDVTLRACGIVTKVREGHDENHHSLARVIVEPALAALRHRSDTRIFQDKTVPEILAAVLESDLGLFRRTFEARLAGTYPPREYTVQYEETDFDFVHRLMEEEGIGYTFEHDGEAERLVLFDRREHYAPIEAEEGAALRFVGRVDDEAAASEGVWHFERITQVRPNRVVTREFDWTHPSVPVVAGAALPDPAFPPLETYVHDAPTTFHGFAHTYASHNANEQLRLYAERARRDALICEGTGSSLALRAGRRFDLGRHPRADLDGAWAITAVEHRFQREHLPYEATFSCLPASVAWRPDRLRDRPRILGVQTATVVGPAGEEIHTDPHGRIKAQFHWDRLGRSDDKSSCWIRVMQTMGGPGWGFSFIPRIGMEVVVTFVEGDLNRPLVTGVVYNGEAPPPTELPANKTRTTIKSSSSPGGGGFNELRLEDKAGQEEIWLHGEKDWNTLIKNDLNRLVGHNEAQEVAVDRTRKVGNDESVTIGHDRKKVVENNESVAIGVDRQKSIGANETVSIGKNAVQSIGQNATQTVGMNRTVNVAASNAKNVVLNDSLKVGGEAQRVVGKSLTEQVSGAVQQQFKQSLTQTIGMGRSVTVTGADNLNVIGLRYTDVTLDDTTIVTGKSVLHAKIGEIEIGDILTISAETQVTIKCGDSELQMTKDGVILRGKKIDIEASDKLNAKGATETRIVGGHIYLN
jgi:type VI secretion system secreted protein VgrG